MAKKEVGEFGTIYTQFKNRPKEAIKHLKKVKEGECIAALYREDIGYVDLVWGENDKKNKGYGLKHIIEKHGVQIKELGFEVEDFIPIIFQFGNLFISYVQTEFFFAFCQCNPKFSPCGKFFIR